MSTSESANQFVSTKPHQTRDNGDQDVPSPKPPTLLSSSPPKSSLETALLNSSSESMGLSELRVCGVAGSAASGCSPSACLVLLALRAGKDSWDVVAGVVVLSSFRLRVEGVLETAVAAPSI
jgi:hypothetical protein